MDSSRWKNGPSVDLEIASAYVEDDREFLYELVMKYLRSSEDRVLQIRKALEVGDLESIQKLAHQMKGGSYYVGCLRMVYLTGALQLETDLGHGAVLAEAIEGELAAVSKTYQEYFKDYR